MKGFILDADVVSSLAAPRRDGLEKFIAWLEQRDREALIFLSVSRRNSRNPQRHRAAAAQGCHGKGATARVPTLEIWLTGLRAGYADRILELDVKAAEASGKIEARTLAPGRGAGMADSMVAGIAKAHGLVVVTHNIKHFRPLGISDVSPPKAAIR